MTKHKHFKQLVRARMEKTRESYATARRLVLQQAERPGNDIPWHFAGNVSAVTALRSLLAHAGVVAPHTREPFSEAMLFGIAGGIGAGVFSFVYEKEDFASFFVAGRHGWQDDLVYLRQACATFGIKPSIKEASGGKPAEKALREMLADGSPCIAWVDATLLPHRAMPADMSGSGYHVITVYRINDDGTALIGDRTDEPLRISLPDLATARARIKKQKNRLLSIPKSDSPVELEPLVLAGLRLCHQGLAKQRMKNFTLDAFRVWGERMHGSSDKEAWERIFTPGCRLWRGLTSINDYIEHYGTGGGLCRPIFADFLREAADALNDSSLRALGKRYAELGHDWTELADAALPDDVPAFREAKELQARKAELILSPSSTAIEETRGVWKRLDDLAQQAKAKFPLSAGDCDKLRAGLQTRVLKLYEGEVAAHAAMGAAG